MIAKKEKVKKIAVYKVTDRMYKEGEPNPDMLRYDTVYVNKKYPGIVIKLNPQSYRKGYEVTEARWESFGQKIEHLGTVAATISDLQEWVTYRHDRNHALVTETMAQRTQYGVQVIQLVFEGVISLEDWLDELLGLNAL